MMFATSSLAIPQEGYSGVVQDEQSHSRDGNRYVNTASYRAVTVDHEMPSIDPNPETSPAPQRNQSSKTRRVRVLWIVTSLIVVSLAAAAMILGPRVFRKSEQDEKAMESPLHNWEEFAEFCGVHKNKPLRELNVMMHERLPGAVLVNRDRLKDELGLEHIEGGCSPETLSLLILATQTDHMDLDENSEAFRARYYLGVFFFAMEGPRWKVNTDWLSLSTYCTWSGLTCDQHDEALVSIKMENNGLSGQLTAVIFELTSLRGLDLSTNSISGVLPPFVKQLTNLQYLSLFQTDISGTIPTELKELSQLTHLRISSFSLEGTIISEIGSFPSLQYLGLESESLRGTVPTTLHHLTDLRTLALHGSGLQGTLPSEVWLLPQLSVISMTLPNLEELNLPDFGSKTNWRRIQIFNSGLTGVLTTSIGLLTDLQYLNLDHNSIRGSIPTEIGLMTSLTALSLGGNHLVSMIPASLQGLQKLESLDLSRNFITGTVPAELINLPNLSSLILNQKVSGLDCETENDCVAVDGLTGTLPVDLCREGVEIIVTCSSEVYNSCPPSCCSCD